MFHNLTTDERPHQFVSGVCRHCGLKDVGQSGEISCLPMPLSDDEEDAEPMGLIAPRHGY